MIFASIRSYMVVAPEHQLLSYFVTAEQKQQVRVFSSFDYSTCLSDFHEFSLMVAG